MLLVAGAHPAEARAKVGPYVRYHPQLELSEGATAGRSRCSSAKPPLSSQFFGVHTHPLRLIVGPPPLFAGKVRNDWQAELHPRPRY
jgi:hypothetical protein